MKQQLVELITQSLVTLKNSGTLAIDELPEVQVERTRDKELGDYACNIAMRLGKSMKRNPRELADAISNAIPSSGLIQKIEIAGPGFINLFLNEDSHHAVVNLIATQEKEFGRSKLGQGKKIHLEYLSSNPTGPLHVGHGRLAAYGATLANLLNFAGFKVHSEYYVNDAGRQMDILTTSVWLRYLELFGQHRIFPDNAYKGEYIIDIAKSLKVEHEDKFLSDIEKVYQDVPADEREGGDKEKHIDALAINARKLLGEDNYGIISKRAVGTILKDMHDDLAEFGVHYQEWFHESSLVNSGDMQAGIERLRQADALYEKDGALWFKASQFGDEKDRVVVRENGQPTYFASDIAYHLNKYARGFDTIFDIFGADHHGYGPRILALLKAAGEDPEKFKVLYVQFAILYRGAERVKMSTRGGSFVTLRELREEVGNDAARYFYIMRKPEQHLDFDLELAKSRSNENPVYYIQYAHARICSVFRQMPAKKINWNKNNGLTHLNLLTTEHEQNLERTLGKYPEIIESAAINHEPHLLAHYLQELATALHSYYNAEQFLVDDENLRDARLCLIQATKSVLASGLEILGLSAPEEM